MMAKNQNSSGTDEGSLEPSPPTEETSTARGHTRFTRTSAIWVSIGIALLLLVLLIIFILQNSTRVDVQFLGLDGTIPLGVALLIAAVGGGVLVAIAGIARITQLRIGARRLKRDASTS